MTNIAVLAAMPTEAEKLINRIENRRFEKRSGRKYLCGTIGSTRVVLHVCGMGLRKAASGAKALIANYSPEALVLFGISGGLVPGLGLYDTVIASMCCRGEGRAATDERLANAAARVLPHARKSPLATTRTVTVRKKTKTRIHTATQAVCVDMESFAVARISREMGVPLLVIRSVSDTFEPASLLALRKNGAAAAEKAAADTEAVIKTLSEGGL